MTLRRGHQTAIRATSGLSTPFWGGRTGSTHGICFESGSCQQAVHGISIDA